MNLLAGYIYEIICSLFTSIHVRISFGRNRNFNVEILIVINVG
jgi:hypothetical protein